MAGDAGEADVWAETETLTAAEDWTLLVTGLVGELAWAFAI